MSFVYLVDLEDGTGIVKKFGSDTAVFHADVTRAKELVGFMNLSYDQGRLDEKKKRKNKIVRLDTR